MRTVGIAAVPWGVMRPAWWPDWMTPPPLMAGGYVRPLGDCGECGAIQYPSAHENHFSACSRIAASPTREAPKAPWPVGWTWPATMEVEGE